RACPKARHGKSGDEPAPVREPFDEHRERYDIAEANTDTTNYAKGEIQDEDVRCSKCRQEDTESVQDAADRGSNAGSEAVVQVTAETGSDAEGKEHNTKGEVGLQPGNMIQRDHWLEKDA